MSELIPAWVGDALQPVDKLEVHRRGLRHMAVSAFVMTGNSVLIQKRALTKYHSAGLWGNTCSTHPRWNEDPDDCVVRRLGEEMGITGLDPEHVGRVEYRADVGGGMTEHEVVDIYMAEARPDLEFTPNPAEVHDALWIDMDDLSWEAVRRPERFTQWLRIYLEQHRETIFGGAGAGAHRRGGAPA